MDKNEYVARLIKGRTGGLNIVSAALLFWHSEIPFEDALKYISTYEGKL